MTTDPAQRVIDAAVQIGPALTPRPTQDWRHANVITDWEFKQIGVLLCEHLPRDLALKIVRLQGQLEVVNELAETRRELPTSAMRKAAKLHAKLRKSRGA